MATDFSAYDDAIRNAFRELNATIAEARRELERFKERNKPTDEEISELHRLARSGELGEDMRELARLVDAGEDSWQAVFSGESPNRDLLHAHLDRMMAQNRDAVAEALADDPELEEARREVEGDGPGAPPAPPGARGQASSGPPRPPRRDEPEDDDGIDDFDDYHPLR